jgi:hypothetical protein
MPQMSFVKDAPHPEANQAAPKSLAAWYYHGTFRVV